jgi:outer membrane protein TolC
MNNGLRTLAMIFSLLSFGILNAQDRRPINLNEAVDLGLKNSKQLKNSQAKIEEATGALKEALERRLPDIKATGAWLWLSNPNIELKTKTSGNPSQGAMPEASQATYGIVNASLPIYSGGRIHYGIESSKLLAEAAKLDADNNKQEVIGNIIEAYINLYKAKSSVNLVKENLADAQQRVKDFSNLEKNGLLPRNDLLQAQLQASNIELSLVDAENNWQLANVNMNLLLGLPDKTDLVPDSVIAEYSYTLKTLDDYIQTAYAQRKDKASVELRKKAAETGVKATKSEYYPNVAVTGGYIAADIPQVLTVTNAITLGAGVSYSLSSLWKTKSKLQQAEARAKQAAIGESLLDDNIKMEVNQAYLNFISTRKKIDVNTKAVEQATENYKIVQNKHNNSLATTTDLLDANVAQLRAKLNLILAKADEVLAYSKLLQSAGLLEQENINK